ncbi:golgi uridine diphosphate-N- acetylglucosamine transporter [Podila humilis]|nr:golgi uridine diphosphate-N- acetylglucosamine transporter [Podila humilis]
MHLPHTEQGTSATLSLQQRHPSSQEPNGAAKHTSHSFTSKASKATAAKRAVSWSTLATLTLQVSLQDWVLIGAMIFGGCCSNVFALEILVNDAPKSGQMITFAQFICVSLYGFTQHLEWPVVNEWRSSSESRPTGTESQGIWRYIPHLQERKIPLLRWLAIVIMFFAASILNNLSLAYKISVPLHIIFRSGGLMVGMVLGMVVMKKRYSASQIMAVMIVTIGVIYATTSTKAGKASTTGEGASKQGEGVNTGDYFMGVVMLTVALIISSLLGLLQEATYQQYGAQWREGLF